MLFLACRYVGWVEPRPPRTGQAERDSLMSQHSRITQYLVMLTVTPASSVTQIEVENRPSSRSTTKMLSMVVSVQMLSAGRSFFLQIIQQ